MTPLLAKVLSESTTKEYYACPKCLSQVDRLLKEPDTADFNAIEEDPAGSSSGIDVELNVEGIVGCAHQLGFLKNRPKNTPIPEACLTCNKMIECMY